MMDNRRRRWYDLFGFIPNNLGKILRWLSIIPIAFIIILMFYAWRADQYDLEEVMAPLNDSSVYDCNGRWMGTLTEHDRVYAARESFSQDLVNAFVAREDEDFFDHGGVVYSSILRSIWRNISSMSYVQGASTITMQLARNCFELKGKTLDRKVLEMAVARRIEGRYSKDEILTAYLNRIYFGQQCYGIAQAAHLYFGKEVAELNLSESATLAGIIRGPSIFNPVKSKEAALKVRNETLKRMLECEMISQEVYEQTIAEPIQVTSKPKVNLSSYPILVTDKELEAIKLDDNREETSGIYVLTSFDLDYQRMLEQVVEQKLVELERSPEWKGTPIRKDNELKGCVQAAALCLDKEGAFLAVMGGRSALDGVNRWEKLIQPGVLFTPIVNMSAVDLHRTVIRSSPEITGRGVGFQPVLEMAEKAGYSEYLPRSSSLYKGMFKAPLYQVVNSLYTIFKDGQKMHLSAVRNVGSFKKSILAEPDTKLYAELLPHGSSKLVKKLPPFEYNERRKIYTIIEQLPDKDGHFGALMSAASAVFVWVGFDEPSESFYKNSSSVAALGRCCKSLTYAIHDNMRDMRKAAQERKEKELQNKPEKEKNSV